MHKPTLSFCDRRGFLKTALLGGTSLALAGCRSGTSNSGVGYSTNALAASSAPAAAPPGSATRPGIIDVHMHVVLGNPDLKPGVPETDRLMTAEPPVVAERVRNEMEQAGVGHVFAMGHQGGERDDPLGIASSLRVARLVPGMAVIGIADPRRTDRAHLRAVERQIERERASLVAFKAYLGYIHAGPDHSGYAPYYKLAAKYGLPFVFHTGDTWSFKAKRKYAHPLGVDAVATDYPEVRFVLAHFGNPWLLDAAEVVFKNDNVWADLSGLYVGDEKALNEALTADPPRDVAAGVLISDLKKAFEYIEGFDRILYGSDWPLAPMPVYRRFAESIIPSQHHEKVFRANAEEVFFAKR